MRKRHNNIKPKNIKPDQNPSNKYSTDYLGRMTKTMIFDLDKWMEKNKIPDEIQKIIGFTYFINEVFIKSRHKTLNDYDIMKINKIHPEILELINKMNAGEIIFNSGGD